MNKQIQTLLLFILISSTLAAQSVYQDPKKDIDSRVEDLIDQLTLEEKVNQMLMNAPAIPRLNIPSYDYWNEALHGVGRSGKATVFPQAIGLAATFDKELIYSIATAISDEARAKYNAARKAGNYNRYTGLTFWTPNINIFRDPRWGRGQETYGEDPYLTGLLGVAFVKGLQGDHPNYLKTSACAKHFAVHSGPEKLRHEFNAKVSKKDLFETYLPAFKTLVDAGVESVMCAYNRTNDEPCCANDFLLNDVLLSQWKFKGHIVSDCGALTDFYSEIGHKTVKTQEEAAVLALKNNVNLNCGNTYTALVNPVKKGLIKESLLDEKLAPLLKTRFKLGLFDPPSSTPYDTLSYDVVDSKSHRGLAYEAAAKSAVLLKNNSVLPLRNDLNRYYVVGPNAASIDALLGNYYGVNPNMVTILEGITAKVAPGSQVQYSPGTTLDRNNTNPADWSSGAAAEADATIVVMGLTRHLEGEEGESISSPYSGDRLDYNIPENQLQYLRKIRGDHKKPVIVIITGGCPMNLLEVHQIADAVLMAWYPGEEAGNAMADILFGKVSPSGRLPVTFPKSLEHLPPYEDYSMKGRTYRYMTEEPMYPFGFGLSYTTIVYRNIQIASQKIKQGKSTSVSCFVKNKGQVPSDEVVQLYVTDNQATVEVPLFSLKGIERIHLEPGEERQVRFAITPEMLTLIDNEGKSRLEKGDFTLTISGSVPIERAKILGAPSWVQTQLTVR